MNTRRSRRAQTLVEMAMLIPVVTMLLTGVFDFARAGYTWASLSYAVREAARSAIVTGSNMPDDNGVFGLVQQAAQAAGLTVSMGPCVHGQIAAPIAPAPATLNTGYVYILGSAPNQPDAAGGQAAAPASGNCLATVPVLAGTYPLSVVVVYTFGPITPFVGQITGSSIQITVSSTMYTEF